jgi:predicted nucleic acid-binding protein
MGSDPPVVVYDACVLYPFHLRNLLIELAIHDLVAARWTDAIHDEWIRNLAATRGIPHARLVTTRDLMKAVLPDADIRGWERHEGGLALPDPNDRHVLAAAIAARASMILTWNVRHFPASLLAMHHVNALDPDSFLADLHDRDPETVAAVLDAARANLRRSEPAFEDYLQALEKQGLATFISKIRASPK